MKKKFTAKDILIPTVSLFVICLVVTALLAVTNMLTAPQIQKLSKETEDKTKAEVLASADEFSDALTVSADGKDYTYYEGTFSRVDDIRGERPVATGILPEPSIDGAPQEDHFAYRFEGLIRIPEQGVWEFATKSDDGSVLLIDGRRVVDNDGSHAAVTATGRVALAAGLHRFELLYFEDYEGQELSWGWRAPGSGEFSPVPAEHLFVK